jgi:hypothetical protein
MKHPVSDPQNGIFVSHVAKDTRCAQTIKRYLQTMYGTKTRVFVSSDYTSITTGQNWFEAVFGALQAARAVVVLISPSTVGSTWVHFEVGIAFASHTKVLPYFIGGLRVVPLDTPLAQLHLRSLEDESGFLDLVRNLDQLFDRRNEIDEKLAVRELSSVCKSAAPRS